ncbi:MAG: type IV secretion system DNA-binding domain-containing protein [Bdellovibrionota bacterium]
MNTWLIKIPHGEILDVKLFEEFVYHLHEMTSGTTFALEICAWGQNIGFFFSAEEEIGQLIIGQLYAKLPSCEITQVDDPFMLEKTTQAFCYELALKSNSIYPLKTYNQIEGDSLSGVLSSLSRCSLDETLVYQIVLKPVADTGFTHLNLNLKRKRERFFRTFKLRHWTKKTSSQLIAEGIENKLSLRLYNSTIRIFAASKEATPLRTRLKEVLGALGNLNSQDLNQLHAVRSFQGETAKSRIISRKITYPSILSTKEIATLYHLPNEKEVPNIVRVLSKKVSPPVNTPSAKDESVSLFGETNFRDKQTKFGIKRVDRRRHFYALGKSGSGKSKLLELLIKNDIEQGKGVGVLDPHGDLIDNILKFIPEHRIKDVIILDPSDLEFPAAFNPLENVPQELKMRVTLGFIEIFRKLFGSAWTARLEHVLRYTTLALLDTPDTTVLSIVQMLTDKTFRQHVVQNIEDKVVKDFWTKEFAGWSQKFDNEAITPLVNKVGQFVATNMIRNIVGQPHNKIDFRDIMDNKKILLMKISKGVLGEENASLLGAIVVTKIYQTAMSRADTPEDQRVDFYFYVDEFQNFATESFDEILSEARKYRLNLTIANQFLGQLDDKMLKTVFGNVGSLLTFRVGAADADTLANEFAPQFNKEDLINLPVRNFALKMTIDGEVKEAFSGKTLFVESPKQHFAKECVEFSRSTYARKRSDVEQELGAEKIQETTKKSTASIVEDSDNDTGFEEPII